MNNKLLRLAIFFLVGAGIALAFSYREQFDAAAFGDRIVVCV